MTAYGCKLWASGDLPRQAAVAVAISLAAIGIRALVDPWIGDRHTFLPAYLAVALATWLATWRAGLATACLSVGGSTLIFDAARNEAEALNEWHGVFALLTGAAVSALIIFLEHRSARLRDTLEHRVELLDEADHRKSDFLAFVAHELRNPLSTLTMGTSLLRNGALDRAAVSGTLNMVERQAALMKRLVSDLMDIARVQQGKVVLDKEEIAISEIIENAIMDVSSLASQSGGPKIVYVPQQPGVAFVDPLRIGQVIGNLLHNAVKFSPPEGVVTVTATAAAGGVCIRVRDQGVGIPDEKLHAIFDSFVQLDATSTHPPGLGLGLSLSRKLVEMHGGSLEARSEGPGRGAEFILRLPCAMAGPPVQPAESPAAAQAQQEPEQAGEQQRAVKLLVVDDNRDAAESLALLLTLKGYAASTAGDGKSALEAAVRERPDMVFLDIGLPDMSGHEVAVKLREQVAGKRPVLVALTGWGSQEDVERSSQAGFDSHLTKPVSLEQLERTLETCSR